jgi:uncharacterized OsmC-like protein
METEFNYGSLNISGDDEKGFRPFQLLVSAIVSCSGLVFNNILVKQRTVYEQLTIEAEVERNESEANRVEKITLHFIVTGENLNEEKLKRNLAISRKHCAMVQSVKGSIIVEDKLTLKNQ